MVVCNRSQFEFDAKCITAEASSLGLTPGNWPDFIAIVDDDGKGFLVQFSVFARNGEDIAYATYYDRNGKLPEVRIFNDQWGNTMFQLTINMDNAAFDGDNQVKEVARILREVVSRLEGGEDFSFYKTLFDCNGNDVGRARLRRKEEER